MRMASLFPFDLLALVAVLGMAHLQLFLSWRHSRALADRFSPALRGVVKCDIETHFVSNDLHITSICAFSSWTCVLTQPHSMTILAVPLQTHTALSKPVPHTVSPPAKSISREDSDKVSQLTPPFLVSVSAMASPPLAV